MPEPSALAREILNRNEIAAFATHNPDGSIHLTALWFMYEDGEGGAQAARRLATSDAIPALR